MRSGLARPHFLNPAPNRKSSTPAIKNTTTERLPLKYFDFLQRKRLVKKPYLRHRSERSKTRNRSLPPHPEASAASLSFYHASDRLFSGSCVKTPLQIPHLQKMYQYSCIIPDPTSIIHHHEPISEKSARLVRIYAD